MVQHLIIIPSKIIKTLHYGYICSVMARQLDDYSIALSLPIALDKALYIALSLLPIAIAKYYS